MHKIICLTAALAISFISISSIGAQYDEEEEGAYKTMVPEGMELQKVGKKDSYKVVLPKGTAVRREGDLRIVEGTGEYASRKFVEYDALLDKMNNRIASIEKEVEDIKKRLTETKRGALSSK